MDVDRHAILSRPLREPFSERASRPARRGAPARILGPRRRAQALGRERGGARGHRPGQGDERQGARVRVHSCQRRQARGERVGAGGGAFDDRGGPRWGAHLREPAGSGARACGRRRCPRGGRGRGGLGRKRREGGEAMSAAERHAGRGRGAPRRGRPEGKAAILAAAFRSRGDTPRRGDRGGGARGAGSAAVLLLRRRPAASGGRQRWDADAGGRGVRYGGRAQKDGRLNARKCNVTPILVVTGYTAREDLVARMFRRWVR